MRNCGWAGMLTRPSCSSWSPDPGRSRRVSPDASPAPGSGMAWGSGLVRRAPSAESVWPGPAGPPRRRACGLVRRSGLAPSSGVVWGGHALLPRPGMDIGPLCPFLGRPGGQARCCRAAAGDMLVAAGAAPGHVHCSGPAGGTCSLPRTGSSEHAHCRATAEGMSLHARRRPDVSREASSTGDGPAHAGARAVPATRTESQSPGSTRPALEWSQ